MNGAMSLARRPSQELSEKQFGQLSLSDTKVPSRRHDAGRSSLGNVASVQRPDNAVTRRFSGGIAVLQAGSVAEDLVAAFLSANQHVLQKVQSLPNGQQLLDICEVYRADVFAFLLGKKFLPDLADLWTTAAVRDAAPLFAPAFHGLDFSLVSTHRMLGGINNKTMHEKHREYLETLNVKSLLANTRAILDQYAVDGPFFDYDWLVEYMKVLRVLFPEWAGYAVVEGLGEFFDIELDYGAVVTAGCDPKVVLIIKGFLGRWPGMERIGERHQELHVWDMSKKMRKEGDACFPERMFWMCFRGVHCGVGWQEGEAFAQRVWPHEDDVYHDVRRDESLRELCGFAQLVAGTMIQCDRYGSSRALPDSAGGRDQ
ncbi:uncharacterized protein LOC129582280 [Paramacrobiotus metropolitanus]|uniref:uncharacterized protein LOC129582280 n=1 Tax=Paramacrobiotus metropolitanus TaxID=2943436 RepID=UPI0024461209|nr:uncharacterized protein LOC129582280 [Paramacrobiotus metropolitanus]